MEADIILEGFKQSILMHNMRYKRFLGDGDSSVESVIRLVYFDEKNNYKIVGKIECKNHAVRRMNTNLRNLLGQKAYPRNQRKILEKKINEIGQYCVYAIEQAKSKIECTTASKLKEVLDNCLEHVFGNHTNCLAYMCNNGKINSPDKYKKAMTFEQEQAMESEADKAQLLPNDYNNIKDKALWNEMKKILDRLSNISKSLQDGMTTNKSECFQSQVAKFTQGKRKNVSYRGGYNNESC